MGHPDVGDEPEGGFGNPAECVNLARMVCAHLHDGHLVRRFDGEQRKRYPDVVVEVALRASGFVTT